MRLLLALTIALLLWVAARASVRRFSSRPRPLLLTVTCALLLAGLNAVNLCAPGWCGWYGFPFPYHSWSDAMVTFNGECSGCPSYRPLAVLGNITSAVIIAVNVYKKERARRVPGPVV